MKVEITRFQLDNAIIVAKQRKDPKTNKIRSVWFNRCLQVSDHKPMLIEEKLEEMGVVGPKLSNGNRKVLIK